MNSSRRHRWSSIIACASLILLVFELSTAQQKIGFSGFWANASIPEYSLSLAVGCQKSFYSVGFADSISLKSDIGNSKKTENNVKPEISGLWKPDDKTPLFVVLAINSEIGVNPDSVSKEAAFKNWFSPVNFGVNLGVNYYFAVLQKTTFDPRIEFGKSSKSYNGKSSYLRLLLSAETTIPIDSSISIVPEAQGRYVFSDPTIDARESNSQKYQYFLKLTLGIKVVKGKQFKWTVNVVGRRGADVPKFEQIASLNIGTTLEF